MIFQKYLFLSYVYECFDLMCVCAMHMPSAHIRQKKASDPLEPELPMVVGHHVGAGTQRLLPTEPSPRSSHS